MESAFKESDIKERQIDNMTEEVIPVSASYKVHIDSPQKEIKRKATMNLQEMRKSRMSAAYSSALSQEATGEINAKENEMYSPARKSITMRSASQGSIT